MTNFAYPQLGTRHISVAATDFYKRDYFMKKIVVVAVLPTNRSDNRRPSRIFKTRCEGAIETPAKPRALKACLKCRHDAIAAPGHFCGWGEQKYIQI